MFTRELYREYFGQVLALELAMLKEARQLAALAPDSESKRVLELIAADEERHASMAAELLRLAGGE